MKKLVLVETLSQFRIRYAVEVEVEDDIDHAIDQLVNGRAEEMSQEHLGEIPISNREITREEYLNLFNKDNDYLKSWTDDQKFNLINRIDYNK